MEAKSLRQFISFERASGFLRGKSVAVVGSAPSVLDNTPGFVDGHDVVVRVNNYKTGFQQGRRCDVHYSFYGRSIRNRIEDLQRDGVKLCWCKCPDAKPIECEWHERLGKQLGIDFRYIYRDRRDWWFCATYIPTVARFLETFNLLERHIPTTGFAAILDVLASAPRAVYLTGFDFFSSGVHNVDEPWRAGDPTDPIGHQPGLEVEWLAQSAHKHPITFDGRLATMVMQERRHLRECR